MKPMTAILSICLAAGIAVAAPSVAMAADAFREIKGNHFVVKYLMDAQRGKASAILNKAEEDYRRIADDIGYNRYQEYWTWERRVSIVLYPDQLSYANFTGQPEWSKAYASRDSKLFHTKVIVSYDDQPEFLDEILPHEISHLIFWDFLGFTRKVPIWFEEGLSQIEEKGKREVVQVAMKSVVEAGNEILFTTLNDLNVTGVNDKLKVSLFYAQSLSVVVFMIEKYGRDAFRIFCRNLRDGVDFESALSRAYPAIFPTLKDLERKWKTYLQSESF